MVNGVKNFAKGWGMPLFMAVVIAVFINKFLFFVISVPSGSMYPTIEPGDRIITTRIYNTDKIKRQDIVVFHSEEFKETMVKRVIGLPEDSVEIKEDGSIFVNGEKLEEPYVKNEDGRSRSFKVPKGEYLFLGDNRRHSLDSRFWENPFISKENIKGKVVFILFAFSRTSKLP